MTERSDALARLLAAGATILGDRLTVNRSLREHHGRGQDQNPPHLPDAVAFPESVDEVSRLLAACNTLGVPVVPFGAGSSLEGQVAAVHGGLSLDLSRLNRVLEVGADDMDCLVESGVTHQQLNAHLRDTGLFMPIDPGAHCTIGGMCATRASGTNAVRYGTIRENVLQLEVVLADGRVIRTGSRARKAANGYDLTHLLVGSEGTLGVITKVRLRLHGRPETTSVAVAPFATLGAAVEAVVRMLQCGLSVGRVELMDEVQIAASRAYSKLDLAARPTLFVEFGGSPAAVAEQAGLAAAIARDAGACEYVVASTSAEREHLWRVRHDAYWAALAMQPGHRGLPTDVCVPVSRLVDAVVGARRDIDAAGLVAPITGHVGDGNFHALILYDPSDPTQEARARAADRAIVARALALGGTCSGEHGIGLGKAEFLATEHGPDALAAMRAIKTALDPRGILNPGKLFDAP